MLNWSFIACCLSNLLFYTSVYVLVPVLPLYLADEFDATGFRLGIVLSLFTFAAMASRPFSGFLVDTFRRKPLYLICYFLFTAHFVGYLLAGTLLTLAIVRGMQGAIFSIATTSGITVMIDLLPPDKQGRGIGIFGVTTSASIFFGTTIGLTVLEHYSFATVFAAALIISTIALLIGATIRFHGSRERDMKTGSAATQNDRVNSDQPAEQSGRPTSLRSRLSFNNIILAQGLRMALCVALMMFLYGAIIHYLTLFVRERDITDDPLGLSRHFFALLTFGLIFGRLIGGWLVDRGGLLLPVIIGKLLMIAAVFVLWKDMFFLSAVLCGLGYGIVFPAYQTIFIRLAIKEQRGIAVSTYRTATDFGVAVALLCGGAIAERLSFFTVFSFGAVLVLLSILLFIIVAAPHFRRHAGNG